jgi:trimethylamine--corrinoid protein Co-methyltransferase
MGAGNLETGNILDPIKLAIDDEIFGMMHRVLREVKIDNDTLGLDAIRRIGIGSGKNYLGDEHTMKHFRNVVHKQNLFTHLPRAMWEAEGRKDLYQRARERVLRILEEYKPKPLDDAIVKELRAISERAEVEIKEVTTT